MDYAVRSFPLGWMPNADEVNGPDGCLLRADNLILDKTGVISVRRGSSKINSAAFADTDVHSLFTVSRSGTRYRYAGATNAVYRNGTSIISGVNGSDDIFFGSHMGQTLIARGTTKKKDDGTTVRNLGIAMTGSAPTVNAALASNNKQFAAWNAAETANHTMNEDDGSGLAYTAGHDGTANAALVMKANQNSQRGVVTRSFGGDQDFSQYTGPVAGSDDDLVSMWVYVDNPSVVARVTLLVDVNGGTFQDDYYYKGWEIGGTGSSTDLGPDAPTPAPNDPGSDDGNPPLI